MFLYNISKATNFINQILLQIHTYMYTNEIDNHRWKMANAISHTNSGKYTTNFNHFRRPIIESTVRANYPNFSIQYARVNYNYQNAINSDNLLSNIFNLNTSSNETAEFHTTTWRNFHIEKKKKKIVEN